MIGQKDLQHQIENLIYEDKFPRFSIIVGQSGSGRKLLCSNIARQLKAVYYLSDNTVDGIRKMIVDVNKVSTKVLYVIADGDTFSPAAKNALLKVTEEPPQNAYFILTLQDLNNTLATIRSRGTVFNMDPYSNEELLDYAKRKTNFTLHDEEAQVVMDVCSTPGEINMILKYGAIDFYSYVEKVVDNVAVVSGPNSFKIANQLSTKADDGKYDMKLFWKAFMSVCATRLRDDATHYAFGIKITSKYLQELRIVGINKASTFDMWLLEIREEWAEWNSQD